MKTKITRKIQLLIDSKDKAFIRQTRETLYRWRHICFRSANYLFTHHFVQDRIKDLIYLTDDVRVKLANVGNDPNGMLVTSPANSTYRLLGNYFKGTIPMPIISCLNRTLVNTFFRQVEDYRKGEKSLPNYKKDIPIPFNAENLRRLSSIVDGREFTFKLFSIPFRTYLGNDHHDKRSLLQRMYAGEVKFCSSALSLEGKKIFLLATFEIEQEEHVLLDVIIAEASLSIDYPVIVKIGKATYTIGTKEEFLYRRMAIQSARQRAQAAVKYGKGGHGRQRKKKSMSTYSDAEKRYVHYRLHVYSRELVNLCIKHQAATLILVDQLQKEKAVREDQFLFRNWTLSGFKDKIMYKAQKAGINLIVE